MNLYYAAGRVPWVAHLLLILVTWAEAPARAGEGCEPLPLQAGVGSSVNPAELREEAIRRFARLGESAAKQFDTAVRLAEITRASLFDVVDVTAQLADAGFAGRDLNAARAAVLDAMASAGIQRGKTLIGELVPARDTGQFEQALRRALRTYGDGKQLGSVAKDNLAACLNAAARHRCTPAESDAHCKGTPRTLIADFIHEPPTAPSSSPSASRRQHQGQTVLAATGPEVELSRDRRIDLVLACRKMAKKSLVAPEEAVFASWLEEMPAMSRLSDGSYRWDDWVKAKNRFGVILRQTFACTYRPLSDNLKMVFD